ncbi:MAG: hypothetical protein VW946_05615 [Gammaproteobacteria bacterium]
MNTHTLTEIDRNSLKLSKILKSAAIIIELLIIALGIYAALETDNTPVFSLVKMLLIVMAICELVKIFSVEAFARAPSFGMAFCAVPALSVGLFLTSQNLLHVNSVVQEQDLDSITQEIKLQKDIKAKNVQLAKERLEIQDNIDKMVGKDAAYKNKLILASISEVDKEIAASKKIIESIISKNNHADKASIRLNIASYESRLKELSAFSENIYIKHVQNVERLNETKLKELESTLFGKGSISRYFNNQIEIIEADHRNQIKEINLEITNLKNSIFNEQHNLKKLNSLNATNKALVTAQENIIKTLEDRKLKLITEKEDIRTSNSDSYNQYTIQMEAIQDTIQTNNKLLLDSDKKVADFKSSHWLFGMASVIFSKEAIDLSIEDLKSFTYYFVLLTSVALAFLPIFLILISVKIEKAVEEKTNLNNRKKQKLIEITYQMLRDVTSNLQKITYNLSASIAKQAHYIKFKNKTKIDLAQKAKQEIELKARESDAKVKKSDAKALEKQAQVNMLEKKIQQKDHEITTLKNNEKVLQKESKKNYTQISELNKKVPIPIGQINELFSLESNKQKKTNKDVISNVISIFKKR